MTTQKITVPDIGGDEVEVIEILVEVGETISIEDSVLTLESDKATMDVPSPASGKVTSILVSVGDMVSEGSPIVEIEASDASSDNAKPTPSEASESQSPQTPELAQTATDPSPSDSPTTPIPDADMHTPLLVIGSGPGGYTAAFRAADLGLEVTLVEKYNELGGVCLNVGCIPSKALLHSAAVISGAREMADHGVTFSEPTIDIDKLRGFKETVIGKLTKGLAGMAKQRKVNVVTGVANFDSANSVLVNSEDGQKRISFEQCIIAVGSRVTIFPTFESDDPRIIDSTGALELKDIPESMLIVGGGIIGLEMATVYSELGSKVSIVELTDQLIPGADKDLVQPLTKRLQGLCENIYTSVGVETLNPLEEGIEVSFNGEKNVPENQIFDKVLVATGRRPNGDLINASAAGINVDERGFIAVDAQMRTNIPHIFAIGDLVGQPMLAHKATHEAKVAAEVAAGHKSGFDAMVIPSVAYTDPEVAWVGLTENQAKANSTKYEAASFPWAASGRAIGLDRTEGKTKVLFDPDSDKLLGVGIVGPHAGDLITEACLAIEMGATAEDISLTVHPHPTLSETMAMATEMYEGTITDLYVPKKRK